MSIVRLRVSGEGLVLYRERKISQSAVSLACYYLVACCAFKAPNNDELKQAEHAVRLPVLSDLGRVYHNCTCRRDFGILQPSRSMSLLLPLCVSKRRTATADYEQSRESTSWPPT